MNQPQVYMYPPILSPPSPAYDSELSPSTSFGCPASCIELELVVCFTRANVHVSTLFSLKPSHARLLPLSPKVCSLHRVSDQSQHFFFVFSTIWTGVYRWITALLVFFSLLPQLVSLLLIHKCVYILVFFHISYYRVWSKFPCVIQWVLVIYFINSIVHILVWSYSFLHGPHLYILVTGNF